MTSGYLKDMQVIDDRLSACENKLEKLEIVLKKILNLLKELKDG